MPGLAGDNEGIKEGVGELCLVIQHLLKVRDVPPLVCGVPGKPLSHMVVYPTTSHHGQGVQGHGESLLQGHKCKGTHDYVYFVRCSLYFCLFVICCDG